MIAYLTTISFLPPFFKGAQFCSDPHTHHPQFQRKILINLSWAWHFSVYSLFVCFLNTISSPGVNTCSDIIGLGLWLCDCVSQDSSFPNSAAVPCALVGDRNNLEKTASFFFYWFSLNGVSFCSSAVCSKCLF